MTVEEAERIFEVEVAKARTARELDAVLEAYLRRLALAHESAAIDRAVARDRERSTGELADLPEEGGEEHA
jgi:hypothetical protein